MTHALFNYKGVDDSIGLWTLSKPLETPKLDWRAAEAAGQRIMAEQARLHRFTIERAYGLAYVWEYGAYSYAVRSSIDWRGHGWDTTILIDGNTVQLRSLDLPRGQHFGNTLSTPLWGIHFGDLRNWLLFRIAIGIFGVVLAALCYTGIVIWWRKRSVRRRFAHKPQSQSEAVCNSANSHHHSGNDQASTVKPAHIPTSHARAWRTFGDDRDPNWVSDPPSTIRLGQCQRRACLRGVATRKHAVQNSVEP